MKQFILFIGGPKCGSSSIQGLLFFNRHKLLRRNNIVYIDKHFGRNPDLSTSHSRMLPSILKASRQEMRSCMKSLASSMSDQESCIFATEGLSQWANCNYAHYTDMFSTASEFFKVKIIVYVRNQVDFLHSAWKQWGIKLEMYDINQYIDYCISTDFGNWLNMINSYARIPNSRVIVRPFNRKFLKNNDIVEDFAELIGISESLKGLSKSKRSVNVSLDDFTMNLAINTCLLNGVVPLNFIHYLKKQENSLNGSLNYLINPDNSKLINDYYSKFNKLLIERFDINFGAIFELRLFEQDINFNPHDCLARANWVQESFSSYTNQVPVKS